MSIVEYIDLYVAAILNIMFCAIIIKKVFKVEMESNRVKRIKPVIITSPIVAIINIYNKDMFKLLITIPFFSYSMNKIFNKEIRKSMRYMIVATLYMFVGEIIVTIILGITKIDYQFLSENILGKTIGAVMVIIATIPLLKIKNLSKKMVELTDKIDNRKLINIIVLLVMGIAVFAYKNTTNIADMMTSIMNIILFVTFVIIIYTLYKEIQKTEAISDNYNILLTYLEGYEKELVEKRKIIHDYKNEIIVINGYIGEEKKLREYVGEIIKEQRQIKESKAIRNIDKLPRGLKGLIYYKINGIEKSIIVDMEVKGEMKRFDEIESKKSKNILKIIGIMIDNAIEAVKEEEEKYIEITFEVKENTFIMEMKNTCSKEIKEKEIMEEGYTTKGKGRGYGLSIVKDIIHKDKSYELKMESYDGEFNSLFSVKL